MYLREEIGLTREELEKLREEKLLFLNELDRSTGKNDSYIKELSSLALIEIELGLYEQSEERILTCLLHFKKQLDRLGQAAALGMLATLFFKKGDYEKCIANYQKALEIYEELNQIQEKITCLMGIGSAFLKMDNYDDACEAFLDCSAACSDNEDIYGLLDCLGNLVQIHEHLERWDVVHELYHKILEAFKELKDNRGLIVSHFNLGILEKKEGDYEHALLNFKKGTNIAIESNYAELIIKGLGYVGEVLVYLNDLAGAKEQYIKALHLADKLKAKNAMLQIRTLLSSLGLNQAQIDEALEEYRINKNEE